MKLLHLALLVALLAACGGPPPPATPPSATSVTPSATAAPPPVTPRATVTAPRAVAAPLAPLELRVAAPGYSGPAELQLFDSRGRPAGTWPLELHDGAGAVVVEPGGALGPQSARLVIGGAEAGIAPQLFTLDAQTRLRTGQPRFDAIYPKVKYFMEQSVLAYEVDDLPLRGYRSPDNPLLWLRDHVYQGRGFRYFERDVTSLLDAFRRAQRPDGSFPDFLARPEISVLEPGRKEVEADVEYLFVQGVYEAWQLSGDDGWLRENLEPMRRAVRYTLSDPLRWDAERRLVKRPYTIDTWDFAYGPTTRDPTTGRPAPRHWIDDQTIWGIFHGDNTGLAHALELLARAEERVGDPALAAEWRAEAEGIMQRLNDLSWNGRFYTHFVPLQPFDTPGVDESTQLSLSNTFALNRGVLRRRQAETIIAEYYERAARHGETFAEWYSIDPPFPPGSYGLAGRPGEQPGEYLNGGIMPLVGGELARGAFRYGAERYAFAILHRYFFLISTTGASYLWYYPAGNPGISGVDTLPTDGWGASAMLGALLEGAAGIEDRGALLREVRLSPRWLLADDVQSVEATARYAASDAYLSYRWTRGERGVTLAITGSGERALVRLPLPEGVEAPASVTLDGRELPYAVEEVGATRYVEVELAQLAGRLAVEW